ncbi:nicotinamide mononucleotide transporter [Janibacter hoylei]
MSIIEWIYAAGVDIADYRLSLMEVIGIGFGLASAVGGMLRKVWAWPIGIVGNVILFFVYIGITMGVDDKAPPLRAVGPADLLHHHLALRVVALAAGQARAAHG